MTSMLMDHLCLQNILYCLENGVLGSTPTEVPDTYRTLIKQMSPEAREMYAEPFKILMEAQTRLPRETSVSIAIRIRKIGTESLFPR